MERFFWAYNRNKGSSLARSLVLTQVRKVRKENRYSLRNAETVSGSKFIKNRGRFSRQPGVLLDAMVSLQGDR